MDDFDIDSSNPKSLFLTTAQIVCHLKAQDQNKYRYLATMKRLRESGVDILPIAKTRALSSAWARHDYELVEALLSDRDEFGVVEVLKALTCLDAGRKGRAEEKLMARLKQAAHSAGMKGKSRLGRRMVAIKKNINNLNKMKPAQGSASGALVRQIRKWTRGFSPESLEFYALHLPVETWRQLADICHLHPEKDFPALPWFLRFCYDSSKAPAESLAGRCQGLTAENVNEYVMSVDIPYAHVKQHSTQLNEEAKTRIARYTKDLNTVIWWYEELKCAGVDKVIDERLEAGETVDLPYGKFMERLLVFWKMKKRNSDEAVFYSKLLPFAEKLLLSVKVPVESPVVVIGDASSSMSVAIETSTIIASFLRAVTHADLVFFSNQLRQSPFIPETIQQVLELALEVRASGCTCHAAALWPYYEQKKIVKTFIVTTDEEENTDLTQQGERFRFQKLFDKYYKEVYPARLIFVSFLRSQHAKGQMVEPLKNAGYPVLQFKMDGRRPDLTKLNNMIGQLATEAPEFLTGVTELEQDLRTKGLQSAFCKLNTTPSI